MKFMQSFMLTNPNINGILPIMDVFIMSVYFGGGYNPDYDIAMLQMNKKKMVELVN